MADGSPIIDGASECYARPERRPPLAWGAAARFENTGCPTPKGDRWAEWSFCCARLSDGPRTTLDFGRFYSLGLCVLRPARP